MYTFISLYDNMQYGHVIDDTCKNYLILHALELFREKSNVSNKYLNQLILILSINTLSNTFKSKKLELKFMKYMNQKLFYTKYIKYKNKYLNLISKNSYII